MTTKDITEENRIDFNNLANHPLQSYEWGEFRKKTGVKVIRKGFFENNLPAGRQGKIVDGFQLTIHKIPRAPWTIGYLPKGNMPTKDMAEELRKIGKNENCVFIQLEPNIEMANGKWQMANLGLKPAVHPLFTKYTFIFGLNKPEEELLKNMHSKTRYNIKIAQKHGVEVVEDNSDSAFETYLKLTRETTQRQKFYAHSEKYHRLMWETIKNQRSKIKDQKFNELTAHLLVAKYKTEPLAAWVLFVFHDTLYYPYGASSDDHREVMASNFMMWETIKFGKKLGLKKFDMWGALGENPNKDDPWYGFHRFKEGYGGVLTEFAGSFDLVVKPSLYQFYKLADFFRWKILRAGK